MSFSLCIVVRFNIEMYCDHTKDSDTVCVCSKHGRMGSICTILVRNPEKKRIPFETCFKLEYNINIYARDIGRNCVDYIYLLQGRGQLRKAVNDVMKLHTKRRISSLPEIMFVE